MSRLNPHYPTPKSAIDNYSLTLSEEEKKRCEEQIKNDLKNYPEPSPRIELCEQDEIIGCETVCFLRNITPRPYNRSDLCYVCNEKMGIFLFYHLGDYKLYALNERMNLCRTCKEEYVEEGNWIECDLRHDDKFNFRDVYWYHRCILPRMKSSAKI